VQNPISLVATILQLKSAVILLFVKRFLITKLLVVVLSGGKVQTILTTINLLNLSIKVFPTVRSVGIILKNILPVGLGLKLVVAKIGADSKLTSVR